MSDDLYMSRLRWDGRSGVAKWHGAAVRLREPPDLGDGPVWAVDYIPEVGIAEIAPRSIDPRRAMTRAEVEAALAFMRERTK